MVDPIVVLNAGSSSLTFSVFVASGGGLEPDLWGNIEEIDTAPRFVAKDRAGHVLAEKSWDEGALRGRLAAAVGDAPSSDRTFREALDLYRAIGATSHAERLTRELDA